MALKPTDQLLSYVGANVYRTRRRNGLTQEALAEVAGIDVRYLQRVEKGQTNLSLAVLLALATALGLEPGELFLPAERPPARRGRPGHRSRGGA